MERRWKEVPIHQDYELLLPPDKQVLSLPRLQPELTGPGHAEASLVPLEPVMVHAVTLEPISQLGVLSAEPVIDRSSTVQICTDHSLFHTQEDLSAEPVIDLRGGVQFCTDLTLSLTHPCTH